MNNFEKLSKDQFGSSKEMSASVAGPSGAILHSGGQNVVPALNQTQGMFISLPATDDTKGSLAQAAMMQTTQQSQIAALTSKVQALNTSYQQKQNDIQQRIQYLQSVVTQLTPQPTTTTTPPASA